MNKRLSSYSAVVLLLTAFTTPAFAGAGHDHDSENTESTNASSPSPADDHAGNSDDHEGHSDKGHSDEGHDEKSHDGEGHNDEGHGEEGHEEKGHSEEGHGDEAHGEGGHEEEGQIEVSATRAKKAGVKIGIAGGKLITDSVSLFGRTEPDPQQFSHVRARFPGLIRSVGPALGEQVSAGQTIAVVEGNDSLQRYNVKAPIDGTVVERHANAGEYAGDNELLTIANYSRLWVSLNVFPQDAARIKPGQVVRVRAGEREAESRIAFLNPGTGNRPSVMARLPLDNYNARWTPGLLIEAEVIVSREQVPLAVDNRAIQRVEGQTVVFRQEGDGFEVVPINVTSSDAMHSEVSTTGGEGLQVGDRYAVQNSYLLKAELEKSGASHSH